MFLHSLLLRFSGRLIGRSCNKYPIVALSLQRTRNMERGFQAAANAGFATQRTQLQQSCLMKTGNAAVAAWRSLRSLRPENRAWVPDA
jgi:hypothetical protein